VLFDLEKSIKAKKDIWTWDENFC